MSRMGVEIEEVIFAPAVNQEFEMPYTKSKFKPYKEAEKVDRLINRVAKSHPPSKDNLNLWTLYHRTIQSTLTLMCLVRTTRASLFTLS